MKLKGGGLVVLAVSCGHAVLINIPPHARAPVGEARIHVVIGGSD